MVVCKFFLEGTCRFGNLCRNEHSGKPQGASQGRFSNSVASLSAVSSSSSPNKDSLATIVKDDLVVASPLWPFSSYGLPGVAEPIHTGPDISLEEIMVELAATKRAGLQADFMARLRLHANTSLEERKLAYDRYVSKSSLWPVASSATNNMVSPFGIGSSPLNPFPLDGPSLPPQNSSFSATAISNPFSLLSSQASQSNATIGLGSLSNPFALPIIPSSQPANSPFGPEPTVSQAHSMPVHAGPFPAQAPVSSVAPGNQPFLFPPLASAPSHASMASSFGSHLPAAPAETSATAATEGMAGQQQVYPISGPLVAPPFDYTATSFLLGKVPEIPPPAHPTP